MFAMVVVEEEEKGKDERGLNHGRRKEEKRRLLSLQWTLVPEITPRSTTALAVKVGLMDASIWPLEMV